MLQLQPRQLSINLGSGESLGWKQIVGQPDMSILVLLAVLLESLARDHDGHGGLGDEVVGKGSEEHTVMSLAMFRNEDF
jgi:hypothetical protein